MVCLLERRGFFVDRGAKKFYGITSIKERLIFDCIAIGSRPSTSIHGVVISDAQEDDTTHTNFVDHFWVATDTMTDLSGSFGLIFVDLESDDFEIIRTPAEKSKASKRNQTMEILLSKKQV
jgi:hypothetical protein